MLGEDRVIVDVEAGHVNERQVQSPGHLRLSNSLAFVNHELEGDGPVGYGLAWLVRRFFGNDLADLDLQVSAKLSELAPDVEHVSLSRRLKIKRTFIGASGLKFDGGCFKGRLNRQQSESLEDVPIMVRILEYLELSRRLVFMALVLIHAAKSALWFAEENARWRDFRLLRPQLVPWQAHGQWLSRVVAHVNSAIRRQRLHLLD